MSGAEAFLVTWSKEDQARHRAQLVEALLSGDFAQGLGKLRLRDPETDQDRWCCLGVGCELYHKALGAGFWDPLESPFSVGKPGTQGFNDAAGDASPTFLTHEVRDYYGFATPVGTLTGAGYAATGCSSLSDMNDSGRPFGEIADVIRAGLVKLAP